MIIAVDGMGGDRAPEAIVEGVVWAIKEDFVNKILLVGPQDILKRELNKYEYPEFRIEIIDAPEIISMDENPTKSLKKKNSSMAIIAKLLKEKKAKAAISAGNTGAYYAHLLFSLGRVPGVNRPAIATVIPTVLPNKPCLVLDVGANVDCKPEFLLQFAYLGSIYYEHILGKGKPRVGLLNIGEEETKGNELVKNTYKLLKNDKYIDFYGNVEGRDIISGKVEVVVCDGFVGNVVLKLAEGVAYSLMKIIKKELTSSVMSKILVSLLRKQFLNIKKIVDHEEYGGAPLLGINGIGIICHGSSGPKAIKNAIKVATECVNDDLNYHFVRFFSSLKRGKYNEKN